MANAAQGKGIVITGGWQHGQSVKQGETVSFQQVVLVEYQLRVKVMIPPHHAGGSKGLGFAMAREFLKAGDSVIICGRNSERLAAATTALRQELPESRGQLLDSCTCDVAKAAQVDALAAFAAERLGTVHFWINNAGVCCACFSV